MKTIRETEEERLHFTLEEMQFVLEKARTAFSNLERKYRDEPRLLENMMSMYYGQIKGIERSFEKPYFARIDFRRKGEECAAPLYIGKIGISDRDSNPLITDWRAPVSSLYYSENLGPAAYDAPGGAVSGELELKRQILIEAGKLREVFDVDSVSDDDLLRPYLGANMENRLKNIVASIQKEQNDIIRRPLYSSLIVQGVAGSGKTTVALHRIAYLAYTYRNQLQTDQFLVIGPNRFFLNYISNVLPDLDVSDVHQLTYEELAADFLGERFQIESPAERLAQYTENTATTPAPSLAYKTSLAYRDALDRFLADAVEHLTGEEGLVVNGIPILSRKEVMDCCRNFPAGDLATRLQMTGQALSAQLRHDEDLARRIREQFAPPPGASRAKANECYDLQSRTLKQQENGFAKALKKYLNIGGVKILPLYRTFVGQIERFSGEDDELLASLKADTLAMLAKRRVSFEDLPALLYLKYRLTGNEKFRGFAHTVVDEAQDFGVFHLAVLRQLLERSTFSIFGDLTQGIYDYHSIHDWAEVERQVFDGNCETLHLEKSYRTTIEIMTAANHISRHLALPEGQPVIRHGDPVAAERIPPAKLTERVRKRMERDSALGYRSIAVICKTEGQSLALWRALRKQGVEVEHVSRDNEEYAGGSCVLTCALAKGLEFDAVILCDADAGIYSADRPLDMKLLYVAMTRALHRLDLLYTHALPGPLTGLEAGT